MILYICYTSADHAKVQDIVTKLSQTTTHEILYDRDNILPGTDWWQANIAAIRRCRIFIYMISRTSIVDDVCVTQFTFARDLNCQILPLVLWNEHKYNQETNSYEIDYLDLTPQALTDMRIQFLYDNRAETIPKLIDSINYLESLEYKPIQNVQSPGDPRAQGELAGDATTIYQRARNNMDRMDFDTARELFQHLTDIKDPLFAGEAHMLIEIINEYALIIRLNDVSTTQFKARERWGNYIRQFPKPFVDMFDPRDLASVFESAETGQSHSVSTNRNDDRDEILGLSKNLRQRNIESNEVAFENTLNAIRQFTPDPASVRVSLWVVNQQDGSLTMRSHVGTFSQEEQQFKFEAGTGLVGRVLEELAVIVATPDSLTPEMLVEYWNMDASKITATTGLSLIIGMPIIYEPANKPDDSRVLGVLAIDSTHFTDFADFQQHYQTKRDTSSQSDVVQATFTEYLAYWSRLLAPYLVLE